jgi:energy-coupling factor transporter transmembrane protein EcfT
MKWQIHPAKENMRKTIISVLFIAVFICLIAILYNFYWALLGLIFLVASLHSYYFPTFYEITEQEVIIKTIFSTQKRKLNEFKKIYIGKNGVLLSPFKHKTFLNSFRGVFLLLPGQRNEIIDYLQAKFNPEDYKKTNG